MSIKVDPSFFKELKEYGAKDISNCFNCGNCTAVCPLTKDANSFPRKMIRKGQLGMKDDFHLQVEPWLCYYCGECSETCPREASPGAYMAALRRYSISKLDPTGIAQWMYKNPFVTITISTLVAVIFAFFMLSLKSDQYYPHWIFYAIPYEVIHNIGIVISIILTVLLLIGITKLLLHLKLLSRKELIVPAFKELGQEIALMRRHKECKEGQNKSAIWDPRLIHLAIMWGFLMLAFATVWDFFFMFFLGMEFFTPARVVGTIGGFVMITGVTLAIIKRLTKFDKASEDSKLSDYWPLLFLWVLAVTGFWLEVVVLLGIRGEIHNYILLIHSALAMELVLFFGITKMAHVIYRPIILLKHFMDKKEVSNV